MSPVLFFKSLFKLREKVQIESPKPSEQEAEMGFLDHLEDLRKTIIRMSITLLLSMILCFGFAPDFMEVLRGPVDDVWAGYEAERLPDNIEVQDWIDAKSLAAVAPQLSPELRTDYLNSFSPEILRLVEAVPILHAVSLLPNEKREGFIKKAQPDAQGQQLIHELLAKEAILREGKGKEALKLMGAFQPGEAFMLSIKLAFFGGLIIAFPLLMYFLLSFIVPGLHEHERKLLYKSVFMGFGLFIIGCLFAYFLVLPRVLSFFYNYSMNMGIENDWRIGYYITFASKLVFVFGVVFELPVVVIPFVKLGVLSYDLMKRTRSYALVGCFFIALLLAPAPDPGTMIIMATPMYLLYELCIFYAWRHQRKLDKETYGVNT